MRVLVTGGAGFLGSHLCEALVSRGDEVVCLDNLSTGSEENLANLLGRPDFHFLEADVCDALAIDGDMDAVCHLASPASPRDYAALPLETLDAGSIGTRMGLCLAREKKAVFLLASTSEVYGDPLVHPQPESYRGNVDPVGPRSVYDEAKRFSEALTMAWHRVYGIDVRIARIHNTYGPRLRPGDGRVVSNFISQALAGEPLTVYGDGSHTRSFCYVDDMVAGLLALLDTDFPGPINLGNPAELTVADLARRVIAAMRSDSPIVLSPLPLDDPVRRRPDITLAHRVLGWEPKVHLDRGLRLTGEWITGCSSRRNGH